MGQIVFLSLGLASLFWVLRHQQVRRGYDWRVRGRRIHFSAASLACTSPLRLCLVRCMPLDIEILRDPFQKVRG
jgi:hypothetical protein